MLLIMFVHGTDYKEEVNFLCFHFNKGIVAACIEILFLIVCALHIRINVGAMCDHFDMEGHQKLLWGRIACAIATITIVIPSIAIWCYFM